MCEFNPPLSMSTKRDADERGKTRKLLDSPNLLNPCNSRINIVIRSRPRPSASNFYCAMKPDSLQSLTFDEFRALVVEILQVDAGRVTAEAYFVTDLGVDSIRMVEVLLRLETLGLPLSPELAWQVQTVGDAYAYYQQQAGT